MALVAWRVGNRQGAAGAAGKAWINVSLEILIHEEHSGPDLEEGFMKGQYDEPNK